MLKTWEFECDCPICLDAKNTRKVLKKRNVLKAALNTSGLEAKVERLLTATESTYKLPSSKVPRLAIWIPYLHLMREYAVGNDLAKPAALVMKGLACLGFVIKGAHPHDSSGIPFEIVEWGVMTDYVVEAWIHLRTAYVALAPHLCQKAEEYARVAYKICTGEDVRKDREATELPTD